MLPVRTKTRSGLGFNAMAEALGVVDVVPADWKNPALVAAFAKSKPAE